MWSRERWAAWSRDARFETERLVLRRYRPEDRAVALSHEQDRRIMAEIRDPDPPEVLRERIDRLWADWSAADGDWLCLAVERRAEGDVVGLLALRVVAHELETVEVGFRFHPDHQRRGFGRESVTALLDWLFAEAGVHKVSGFCTAENAPSAALMEALGFRLEGNLREHSRLGGRWRDERVFGLLAGDRRQDSADASPVRLRTTGRGGIQPGVDLEDAVDDSRTASGSGRS